MTSDPRRTKVVLAVGTVASTCVLVLSPLLLVLLDRLVGVDWPRLSEIGQSYTGTSALLAAGALVAVAYSTRLQSKQTRIIQLQSVRSMQFDLVNRALDDPRLAATFVDVVTDDQVLDQFRSRMYISMRLRFLQFSYLAGELSAPSLQAHLRGEVFRARAVRCYWEKEADRWAEAAVSRSEKRFVQIVHSAYQSAAEVPE